jgi:hypothetical protein
MGGALAALGDPVDCTLAELRREIGALRHGVDVMREITRAFLDIHALRAGRVRLHEAWTNVREMLDRSVVVVSRS